MRVAIITRYFYPSRSYIENICFEFFRKDHQVCLFTAKDDLSNISAKSTSNTKSIYYVKGLNLARNLFFTFELLGNIKKFSPDLIITIGVGDMFSMQIPFSRFNKTRFVTIYSDTNAQYNDLRKINKNLKRYFFYLLKGWIYKKFLDMSHLNIGVTPETIGILDKIVLNKSIFRPLPFNKHIFQYAPKLGKEFRTKYGFHENDILIGVIGRQTPVKQNINVYYALSEILSSNYDFNKLNIKIILFGMENGDCCKEYQDKIHLPFNAFFFPMLGPEELNEGLNAIDACIYPRQPGISLLQAIASGCYCIIPHENYFKQITHNIPCNYIENSSVACIREAILDLIENIGQLRIERKSRTKNLEKISAENFFKDFLGDLK